MTDPAQIVIDEEKALKWLKSGAQPSDTARSLMSKAGIWEKFIHEKQGESIPGSEAKSTSSSQATSDAAAEESISTAEEEVEVTEEATEDNGPETPSEEDN
jgi:hypothetical protein